ncbi:MAG TPA: DUF6491 family protein [Sphingorhabdus sp.]|jgi:hypothetical protein|nr:DUF6491 family protein [Sphingorhabdus sp.]
MKNAILIALAATALAAPAQAKKPTPHVWPELGIETGIAFANRGEIRNFEADGQDGVWLEDQKRRWYYAELKGGCQGLNFVQAIGFDTNGSSNFDKYSSIIVDGWDCPVSSLVTAEKPLPRKERERLRKAAIAEGKKAVAPSN